MTPNEIGKAYDQITSRWNRDDYNRENGIAQHQRAIKFVENRGAALDVGCGCTGRFIDLLQGEGFKVQGIDVSEEMIQLAKKRHPEVQFHHQDICEWQIKRKFDFITAWDSIWHVPLQQQEQLICKLVSSLNSGGVLIFSFGGTDEKGEHKNKAMGPEVYYSTLGVNGFLELFLKLGCICRHLEYDQPPELHSYLIVQKQ